MSTSVTVEQLILKALEEALSRVFKKISEGKKLSYSEAALLLMSLMIYGERKN